MKDEDRSRAELIAELTELRNKVADLEGLDEELRLTKEELQLFRSMSVSSREPTDSDEVLRIDARTFHTFMNNSPVVAFLKDDQGRLVYVNKQSDTRLNQKLAEIHEPSGEELPPGKDRMGPSDNDGEGLNSNKAVEILKTIPDSEGKPSYWWTHKFSIQDSSGRLFTGGVALDITASKRAEEELRETKTRLEALLNATPDAAHLIDTRGRVLALNQPSAKRLGTTVDRLRGRVLFDFFPPDSVERAKDNLKRIIETGSPARFERILEGRTYDTNLFPVFGADGAVEGMAVFARDITESKIAAENLKESEERYRTLAENSLTGIFIHQDDRAVYVNPHLAEMMGYSPEEFTELDLFEPVHPEDREELARITQARSEGNDAPSQYETRLVTKDGDTRWAVIMASRINYRGKPATIGNVADITDRKRAEQQVQAALEEKELLLREIHHRVKNNLQIMSSLLKLQARRISDKDQQDKFREAESRVRSMALVHERMYESGSLRDVNILKYIAGMVNYISAVYGVSANRIRVKTVVRDVSLGIDTAVPLGFILNELLSNCLKHAFPDSRKGSVTISLTMVGTDEYELIVADDGVGLPEDMDHRHPKTLGLELVGVFADQLRAQVEVLRTNGTEFRVRFQDLLTFRHRQKKQGLKEQRLNDLK